MKVALFDTSLGTDNAGDYFISDSVKSMLDTQFVLFQIQGTNIFEDKHVYERINDCDIVLITGTNLYRNSIFDRQHFNIDKRIIAKIKIPIIPFGIGVGGDLNISPNRHTRKIVKLIHKRCIVSSVREGYGVEFVNKCGATNVIMTGCPTLYRSLDGNLRVFEKDKYKKRMLLTITCYKGTPNKDFIDYFMHKYNPFVFCQMESDFVHLMENWPDKKANFIYSKNLSELASEYHNMLDKVSIVVGSRVHGNMVALARGIPAYYLCFDARGKGFCETFSLPYVWQGDSDEITKIEKLIQSNDSFKAFETKYSFYYKEMKRFLSINNIPNKLK